jgi:hypothetical protein
MKLRAEINNLVAENQKLQIKLKAIDRQSELDYLEKQQLLIELAALKAENAILREKAGVLSPSGVSPGSNSPTMPSSLASSVASSSPSKSPPPESEQPDRSPMLKINRSANFNLKASIDEAKATSAQTTELLNIQNQILRSKIVALTEEVSFLENSLLSVESKVKTVCN